MSDSGDEIRHKKKSKFSKKKNKKEKNDDGDDNENGHKDVDDSDGDDFKKAKLRNPKAFALQSYVAAERQFRRTQDVKAKRLHIPEVDRSSLEPPPIFIAIVGPSKVGKSLLMQNLIRNYTRQKVNNIKGPVTVVTSKNRRLTFYECENTLTAMIDTAKVADLVLLMIDASFGFEMETFEFLNICQVHGFPRIMGVLTHMDLIANNKQLKKTKKKLKHRFWTEIYQGAKLFYLTGLVNEEYRKHEIHNLARFISVMKFKDLGFRVNHSFVVADRFEDLTQPDLMRQNLKVDRNVCLYGYVRGCPLKRNTSIHIPGCGDFQIDDITFLSDPCPLPSQEKKRTLDDRERLIYAPFSGVGGIVYDKDAVYIELGGSHSHNNKKHNYNDNDQVQNSRNGNNPYIKSIIESKNTIDSKLIASKLSIFSSSDGLTGADGEKMRLENEAKDFANSKKNEVDSAETKKSDKKNVRFEQNSDESDSKSENDDDDDDEDLENNYDDDDDDEDQENNYEEEDYDHTAEENSMIKWKQNLKLKASLLFDQNKKTNWRKLIYETDEHLSIMDKIHEKNPDSQATSNLDNTDNDLFKIKKINYKNNDVVLKDNTKYETFMNNWCLNTNDKTNDNQVVMNDSIRDCFMTGKWEKDKDAEYLLNEDKKLYDDDDEDLFGDFEDFESGKVYKNGQKDSDEGFSDDDDDENDDQEKEEGTNKQVKRKLKSEKTKSERFLEKKKRIKEKFNMEFDGEKDDGESSFYNNLLQEANNQTNLNRLEFEKMDDKTRVEYEGFRAGMYVRIEIKKMPYEFVENFDAKQLVICGSLGANEMNVGYCQVRMKKHRWHRKILKTKDPLIVSLGWRRFQTIPLYFIQDHNMRNRSLKYTPQHMYCHASFWGPISAQNSGFLAVQSLSNENRGFRIAATGVITDMNKSTQIVKKLKLIGTPLKIFRKTAFIQGMFSTALEASKFEGASIKSVSGIRGQIKKALRSTSVPAGSVRATFEDKILASDTIFLKSWFAVEVPKFYLPITNLLTVKSSSNDRIQTDAERWQGLKTLAQLKIENNIKVVPDENSLYKPIVREEKIFAPLKINKSLQEKLPFSFKSKELAIAKDTIQSQRIAIMREPEEAKLASVMKMFKKVHESRMKKKHTNHLEHINKYKKEKEKIDLKRLEKSKELKKQVYCRLGKQERKKTSRQSNDE